MNTAPNTLALCRLYVQKGACKFGDMCKFSHDVVNLKEQQAPLCRFIETAEGCTYGDKCRFSHAMDRVDVNEEKKKQLLEALGGRLTRDPNMNVFNSFC
jgi:hypothetical protein